MSETFDPDPIDEPREWPALRETTLAELELRVGELDEHAGGDDVLLWLDRAAAFVAAAKALQNGVYRLAIAWIQANGELRLSEHVRFGVGHQRVVRCLDVTATLHAAIDALNGDLDGVGGLLAAGAWKHGACRQALPAVAFNRLFVTEVRAKLVDGRGADLRLVRVDDRYARTR
jgi:hypothetical protein